MYCYCSSGLSSTRVNSTALALPNRSIFVSFISSASSPFIRCLTPIFSQSELFERKIEAEGNPFDFLVLHTCFSPPFLALFEYIPYASKPDNSQGRRQWGETKGV